MAKTPLTPTATHSIPATWQPSSASLNIYTTDVDTLLQHFGVLTERFDGTGVRFASTLLGVARLAGPDLLVALEATAMD